MKESVSALSSVAARIASVRCRADCLRVWQKPNANNPDQNVNYVLKFHGYFPLLVFRLALGFNKISPACQLKSPQARTADSSFTNAVNFSSARRTKRFSASQDRA
jgi:hypothetical protein